MNRCISQVLDVNLFKRLLVTLNSEGMAKDIGVESFCFEDTGEHFMFYVGITLLHRCKSFGSKGQLGGHLEGGWHLSLFGIHQLGQ